MTQLLLLIVCLALGILLKRFANPPATLAQGLNWWVLYVALPALVLNLVPQLKLDWHLWFLPVSLWLVFLGAWLLFALLGRLLNWSRARIGALTLVCGLGNTSFVGYPLVEALRGHEGLALAVIADQLGCFVTLAIAGAFIPAIYSNAKVSAAGVVRRMLLFPAFIAVVVALGVGLLGGWPETVNDILSRIGSTLVPLALFSVGLQIRASLERHQLAPLILGLGWKLFLAPLGIFLLGTAIGVAGLALTISVLQSAMAPMISAAIVAEQNNLEPRLANLVLAVGIVLSFVTVTVINSLL